LVKDQFMNFDHCLQIFKNNIDCHRINNLEDAELI